jgi:DNA-binding transcriptional LysR family regulator
MELRHLTYFVAVAEERSFTRAAERLWVAQPGLSTQIRRLEAELGVQLLERHPRGVEPTAAGELLLERARAALAAAEVARNTGHDLQAGLVGSIRVGLATGAAWSEAPALLQSFARERPDVEVTVFEAYAGALLRDLRDGRLHAVLAPAPARTGELHSTGIGSVPWLVLAGAGHSLAHDSGPVAAHELDGEAVVVTRHRDGTAYDDAVAATLSELGAVPELRRGGPGPALFADVADGTAVALATSAGAAGAGVVARPLAPARSVDFAVLWREAEPEPALGAFIDAAARVAPARPALRAVA